MVFLRRDKTLNIMHGTGEICSCIFYYLFNNEGKKVDLLMKKRNLNILYNILLSMTILTSALIADAPNWQDDPGGYQFLSYLLYTLS